MARVERFAEIVISNRENVARCLNTGEAAKGCQAWIASQGLGAVLPATFAPSDEAEFQTIARRATLLERYVAEMQGGRLSFRPWPAGSTDFDITTGAPAPEGGPPVFSFGVIPVLVIIVGAVIVLLAAAITTAIGFYADVRRKEEETKRKIADLDLAAAKAGGSTASNWAEYKKTNAEANGGILGALGKNLGTIAIIGGIIAIAIIASKALPQRKAAA
jgi:hypothetical protein